MLHCFSFIIFSLTSLLKKILTAGRKCYSCNCTQVSMFIGVWQLHAAIPCGCVWNKIPICNTWELEEFKTTCKLVFNRLWKPSVSSLYFLNKPNPKNLSTLKYAFRPFAIYHQYIIFISFACSVGTTKFCQWKRKL